MRSTQIQQQHTQIQQHTHIQLQQQHTHIKQHHKHTHTTTTYRKYKQSNRTNLDRKGGELSIINDRAFFLRRQQHIPLF